MPGKGNKNSTSGVEMYSTGRYFTMTGIHLDGTPDGIVQDTVALPWIHDTYVAKKRKSKPVKVARKPVMLPDDTVLEKARAAANGDEFTSLWEGKWQERFGSQSEADLSLGECEISSYRHMGYSENYGCYSVGHRMLQCERRCRQCKIRYPDCLEYDLYRYLHSLGFFQNHRFYYMGRHHRWREKSH
jgi:hypothetical protein